jgi:hypothetical protein
MGGFCCFQKNKNKTIKDIVLETDNVLVTGDRFTEMSCVSDYSKSISFFNREDDEDDDINDLMETMIWRIEIDN